MKCKFCGCTDDKPCLIPISEGPDGGPVLAMAGEIAIGTTTCGWLIDTPKACVCTAPACVAKAYAEASLLADQLQFWIERGAA